MRKACINTMTAMHISEKKDVKVVLNGFIARITDDEIFRKKWIYTLCVLSSFIIVGWLRGQFGPSFLDLLWICNTDLETGSWIVTVFYIGYVVGSVIGGVLYSKLDQKILICLSLLMLAIVHITIPWCFLFELMLTSHFFKGTFIGILNSVGCAEIVRTWREKSGKFLMAVKILSSIGSALSPLSTAPFLMDQKYRQHFYNTTMHNMTSIIELHTIKTNSTTAPSIGNVTVFHSPRSSEVYKAYFITAGICTVVSVPFIILLCMLWREKSESQNQDKTKLKADVRKLPRYLQIISFFVFGAFMMFFAAIDEGFLSYLAAFCVENFAWTKTSAAVLISCLYFTLLVARVTILCVMHFTDTIVLTGIFAVVLFVDMLGFMLMSIYNHDVGIWVFSVLFGIAKSASFPLIMSWTNEYIFPVTGKISSYFMIVSMVGSALNPLLLGYLMEYIGSIAFTYVFFGESSAFLIMFVFAVLLTKYITNRHGMTYSKTSISKDIDENENFPIQ